MEHFREKQLPENVLKPMLKRFYTSEEESCLYEASKPNYSLWNSLLFRGDQLRGNKTGGHNNVSFLKPVANLPDSR